MKEIIVAIELSSTAIRGIAGYRQQNGSIEVQALAEEPAVSCMHKGIIDNIEKTSQAITRIVESLNFQLGVSIKKVYVGLGGFSLRSRLNVIQNKFPEKTQVTGEIMDNLMDRNKGTIYSGADILEVIPQECIIGNRHVDDPVGVQTEQIEACFLNLTARSSIKENIEKCISNAGLHIADIFIAPLKLADTVLRADEKRNGCALVDMGAETTTVSIYHKNLLRHLIVLPLGGDNVTADLIAQKIDAEDAESIKLKYGTAYRKDLPSKGDEIKLKYDKSIPEDDVIDIIEARYEEIVANIWHQIKPKSENLLTGLIITGGASKVKNLTECFNYSANCAKQLRIVKGLPEGISLVQKLHIPDDGRYNTLFSLLLHGDQNCAIEPHEEPEPETQPISEPEQNIQPDIIEESKPVEEEPQPQKTGFFSKIWKTISDAVTESED